MKIEINPLELQPLIKMNYESSPFVWSEIVNWITNTRDVLNLSLTSCFYFNVVNKCIYTLGRPNELKGDVAAEVVLRMTQLKICYDTIHVSSPDQITGLCRILTAEFCLDYLPICSESSLRLASQTWADYWLQQTNDRFQKSQQSLVYNLKGRNCTSRFELISFQFGYLKIGDEIDKNIYQQLSSKFPFILSYCKSWCDDIRSRYYYPGFDLCPNLIGLDILPHHYDPAILALSLFDNESSICRISCHPQNDYHQFMGFKIGRDLIQFVDRFIQTIVSIDNGSGCTKEVFIDIPFSDEDIPKVLKVFPKVKSLLIRTEFNVDIPKISKVRVRGYDVSKLEILE